MPPTSFSAFSCLLDIQISLPCLTFRLLFLFPSPRDVVRLPNRWTCFIYWSGLSSIQSLQVASHSLIDPIGRKEDWNARLEVVRFRKGDKGKQQHTARRYSTSRAPDNLTDEWRIQLYACLYLCLLVVQCHFQSFILFFFRKRKEKKTITMWDPWEIWISLASSEIAKETKALIPV